MRFTSSRAQLAWGLCGVSYFQDRSHFDASRHLADTRRDFGYSGVG